MKAPVRVLLISHTCQSRTEGQPKAQCLARMPEIDLQVMVPDRWKQDGRWLSAQPPEGDRLSLEIAKVTWPWAGPAQNYLHWYPGLRKKLAQFRPDIIDIWEEPWGLVSAQVCRLRNRFHPTTKVLSETEQNINRRLPPPFERMRAYTLRHADFAVGRSQGAVEVLRAKGYTGPAEVVPNAVDAERFRPMDRELCRQKLGLRGFVAGYVGRLVPRKGLLDLLNALPLCSAEVNLLFVGSGEQQAALEARVQELGLQERVRFLANQPSTALPEIMNALNALVLPSRTVPSWREQFGRVIIEAHACATPVIGSDSGAIPEVIGAAGHVFPEGEAAPLAGAIERLHAAPEEGRRLGQLGRQRVEERFTWQRVAERMRDIYLTMCPHPSSTG